MTEGRIFSIEEFSVYDGPGIRMSVFLKGCPLRCSWCHNPEGQKSEAEIIRSPNGCIQCGACLKKGEEITGKPCLVKESIDVCPRLLVRLCGREYSSEELVSLIKSNADMLNEAKGGVTFSGGEPLSQPEFLLECLKKLKGVTHRAVQTSGFGSRKVFEQVINNCDIVLYDIKIIDSELHRKFTGVSNEIILENFELLAKSGRELCVRIPLIPTVTDTEENITAAAAYGVQAQAVPMNTFTAPKDAPPPPTAKTAASPTEAAFLPPLQQD